MRPERDAVVVDERQPLLALGDHIVGLHPLGVHRQHLAKTAASDSTWKPPLSVKVGPGQVMKAPRPLGSTISAPGCR